MNCPVCNTTELSEDTTACPQCHSDLEVFQLIVKASEQRQTSKKIISALGLFAAVTAIGWASVGIFSGKAPEPVEVSPEITVQNEVRTPADSELIAMLTNENASLKSTNASLTAKIIPIAIGTVKEKPVVNEKPAVKEKTVAPKESIRTKTVTASAPATEGGTITHTVRNGDTFWIIAKKYFHDGRKYKQIAKDNGMTVKTKLHKGQKLKIVKG